LEAEWDEERKQQQAAKKKLETDYKG